MPNRRDKKRRDAKRMQATEELLKHNRMASRLPTCWRQYTSRNDQNVMSWQASCTITLADARKTQEMELRHKLLGSMPPCIVCRMEPPDERLFMFYTKCCHMAICIACLHHHLDLDSHPSCRPLYVRSYCSCRSTWSFGYGCRTNARYIYQEHCYRNITITNLIHVFDTRRLHCFKCSDSFENEADLYHHIADKCPEIQIKCPHCSVFGKRGYILGEHAQTHIISCQICSQRVPIWNMNQHMSQHMVDSLKDLMVKTTLNLEQCSYNDCYQAHNILEEIRRLHKECGGEDYPQTEVVD